MKFITIMTVILIVICVFMKSNYSMLPLQLQVMSNHNKSISALHSLTIKNDIQNANDIENIPTTTYDVSLTSQTSSFESSFTEGTNDPNEDRDERWWGMMTERFMKRKKIYKDICATQSGSLLDTEKVPMAPALSYYVPEYKVFACVPAKSGASTWKTHLMKMRGFKPPESPHVPAVSKNIKTRFVMNRTQFAEIMKSSEVSRILMVRHPISRLISAFTNKFNGGSYEVPDYIRFRYIRQALRLEGIELRRGTPARATFRQFINLILYQKNQGIGAINHHWKPQDSICNSCALPYDVIIKMETFSEDLQFLILELDIKEVNVTTRKNSSHMKGDINYEDYFEGIPDRILREIYDLYKNDFHFFDYEVPHFLKVKNSIGN